MNEDTRKNLIELLNRNSLWESLSKWQIIELFNKQVKKFEEANEFIKDIVKLLWEDDLWQHWKSWSIEDFENAIEQAKQEERKRIIKEIKIIEINLDKIMNTNCKDTQFELLEFISEKLQELKQAN